jgi:hypothetical protein
MPSPIASAARHKPPPTAITSASKALPNQLDNVRPFSHESFRALRRSHPPLVRLPAKHYLDGFFPGQRRLIISA